MAWLEGCTGCGKTKTTLHKIEGGPRICKACKDKLISTRQLNTYDGKGKLVLKGHVVTFVPMVKGGSTDDGNRSKDAAPQGGSDTE